MYKVLVSDSKNSLESQVKDAIGEGWILAGGVCVYPNESTITSGSIGQHSVKLSYAQAMTKGKNV